MHMITMFSKQGCTFCEKAKILLQECGLKFEEVDVTEDVNYCAHLRSSGATVPRIWNHNTFIGGYTELCDYLLERDLVPL